MNGMTTWLIDARTLASRPTGIGMYAFRIIRRMLEEEAKNSGEGEQRKFVLVCDVETSAELAELKRRGCEVRTYGRRVFNSLGVMGYLRFVKRMVAEVRPDVFWQPNNLQPLRVKGVPRVIVTMHDVFGLTGWSVRYCLWHLYYRSSFGRTLRNVTEVWFNSRETESHVRAAAGRRLDRLVTKVVHPPTEVPRREGVRPYPHGRPYFLFVGNFERRKGADVLLEAFRRYRAAGGKADLIFAGLARDVDATGAEGVTVLGYVDEATKFSLLCSALALVVPSRAEGYGMQVAEAVALGVKCLASDLTVFREIDGGDRIVYLRGYRDGTDEVRVTLLAEALEKTVVGSW